MRERASGRGNDQEGKRAREKSKGKEQGEFLKEQERN